MSFWLVCTHALNEDLVLLALVVLDDDTLGHLDVADPLLTKEVTDLKALSITGKNQVDREMVVHGAHLVLEADGNTLEHVVNSSGGSTDASVVLTSTVPHNELHLVALGALDKADVHRDVTQVLVSLVHAPW